MVAGTGQLLQASKGQAGCYRLTGKRHMAAALPGARHWAVRLAGNRPGAVGVTADSNAQPVTAGAGGNPSRLPLPTAASKQLTGAHLAWNVQDACTAMKRAHETRVVPVSLTHAAVHLAEVMVEVSVRTHAGQGSLRCSEQSAQLHCGWNATTLDCT